MKKNDRYLRLNYVLHRLNNIVPKSLKMWLKNYRHASYTEPIIIFYN